MNFDDLFPEYSENDLNMEKDNTTFTQVFLKFITGIQQFFIDLGIKIQEAFS